MNKKPIIEKIRKFIRTNNLISQGDSLLLAVSAGKDSMALLRILLILIEEYKYDIALLHLNHKMRGRDSDLDEEFVRNIAEKNNLKIFTFEYDFKNHDEKKYSFEEHARIKRYDLLDKVSEENNFNKIVTAHNRDDNIETILMRIFTGTGINGLKGILPRRKKIIRPLLEISSEEIYEFLKQNNIEWREDSSNKENKYSRNYIRNTVLPEIYKKYRSAGSSILSLSGNATEYDSIIKELMINKWGKLYTDNGLEIEINYQRYISDKRLLKYVILNAVSSEFGLFLDKGILEEIVKKAKTNNKNIILYRNRKLIIKKCNEIIKISPATENTHETEYNKKIDWNYNLDLSVKNNEKSIFIQEINKTIYYKFVDYSYFEKHRNINPSSGIFVSPDGNIQNASIRNRRKGDRIRLEYGSKKIKDLLIDNKINILDKDNIPLLLINSTVAAIMPGFMLKKPNRISSEFYINRESEQILAVHL